MGVGLSRTQKDFEVIVKTGDVKGAGTDSNVYITLVDEKGCKSREVNLDCTWRDDFEKGNEDKFNIYKVKKLGAISAIQIRRDRTGLNDDWFVEFIKVRQFVKAPVENRIIYGNSPKLEHAQTLEQNGNGREDDTSDRPESQTSLHNFQQTEEQTKNKNKGGSNKKSEYGLYPFPINRWIKADRVYTFTLYDSVLPQDDVNKKQRDLELQEKKEKYIFLDGDNSLPRRIKICPLEENFSNDYKWDIIGRKMKFLTEKFFMKFLTSTKWESLDALVEVYKGSFGIPDGYYNWKSDEKFGQQRLRGCNAKSIELCEQIPKNFAVTPEMLLPFLGGKTLKEALQDEEIYIVDLKFLEDIVCKNDRTICPAMALFHAKGNGELMPIAIQLFQKPSEKNPVFLPNDPTYTWMAAKMFFNNADCSYHQACAHLGFTHLVVESICVSMHRTLSPSHPIFRLLAPHFLYLIAINSLAVEKLLSPEGWIDVTMTMGVKGLYQILKKRWSEWRLDMHAWLPNDLKARKVDNTEKLKNYMYREDGLKIHYAILKYVTEVITNVYGDDNKLTEDSEIQDFARTLVDTEDGAGIKGVFGNGKFEVLNDLIKTVASVIFLSSVGHAAANFCQYDEYAFPPNYPATLCKEPPANKTPLTEKDILESIPNKDNTLSIMVVTKILSDRGTNGLGDFEIQYQYDPKSVAAVERFKENLKRISEEITVRNQTMQTPYPYLDPKEVPNAISI